MHVGGVAHAHLIGLTCEISGPCACCRSHVRMNGPMHGRVGMEALAALLLDWNCGAVVAEVLAAGPLCWQHEPFNAQRNPIGGMVGSLPRPPPIGLTCASMGPGVHLPGLGHHLSG